MEDIDNSNMDKQSVKIEFVPREEYYKDLTPHEYEKICKSPFDLLSKHKYSGDTLLIPKPPEGCSWVTETKFKITSKNPNYTPKDFFKQFQKLNPQNQSIALLCMLLNTEKFQNLNDQNKRAVLSCMLLNA